MTKQTASKSAVLVPAPSACDCTHRDPLTCLAEKQGMSRFNAMIVFATGKNYGQCTCACHRQSKQEARAQ